MKSQTAVIEHRSRVPDVTVLAQTALPKLNVASEVTRETRVILKPNLAASGGGLGKTVHYLGYQHPADLAKEYGRSHGVVLFSWRENFGYAVAEAMCCGRPVFISSGVDLHDLVTDRRCGLVFDIQKTTDIKEAFRKSGAISNAEWDQMGQRGRTTAESSFDELRFRDRLVAVLRTSIEGR